MLASEVKSDDALLRALIAAAYADEFAGQPIKTGDAAPQPG